MWNAHGQMHRPVLRLVRSTCSMSHRANRVFDGPLRAFAASSGYTLVELLFALVLSLTLGAVAAPQLLAAVDDVRAAGAVRYLATKLQQARMEAIARSADVGWQFVAREGGYTYAPYVDGNGNGIRTRDIQSGIDPPIGVVDRLADHFAGVDFGVGPGLPPPDRGGAAPGTDPIKLGSSNILTFSALGTSSSGSLYVRGRRDAQFVVRILGETGRVRVLKFDPRTQTWKPA
jgi:type II secretory pathway pseudopilin PulG